YCNFFFFFSSRRRHTRSKRDWSSDVCSSDLRECDFPFVLSLKSFLFVFTIYLIIVILFYSIIPHIPLSKLLQSFFEWCVRFKARSEERRVGKECRGRWAW